MKNVKIAGFGLALAGAIALAMGSVVAQGPQGGDQERRSRPRVMMLDGRGAQIGVTVDEAPEGVRIADVDTDSPASRAGLRSGDVVVEVDGERVRSARQFSRLIQESPDGRRVRLGILRGGERQTIEVTPEARAFNFDFDFNFDTERIGRDVERSMREMEPRLREYFHFDTLPRRTSPRGRLGVQTSELTPELAEYFGAKDGGVLVARVTADSPAAKAGLKVGDVITSVNGDRVRDTSELMDELRDKEGDVTLGIVRDKRASSVTATLDEAAWPRPGFRRPA
jgi:serine protease Do